RSTVTTLVIGSVQSFSTVSWREVRVFVNVHTVSALATNVPSSSGPVQSSAESYVPTLPASKASDTVTVSPTQTATLAVCAGANGVVGVLSVAAAGTVAMPDFGSSIDESIVRVTASGSSTE